MSINDLLDSDITILFIMLAIGFPFYLLARFNWIKRFHNNVYGDYECGKTMEETNTKIIAKRTITHPFNKTVMINMVLFELANGSRIELAIKDSTTYGIMIEGDCGTLKHQGKKFVSFERGNINET